MKGFEVVNSFAGTSASLYFLTGSQDSHALFDLNAVGSVPSQWSLPVCQPIIFSSGQERLPVAYLI